MNENKAVPDELLKVKELAERLRMHPNQVGVMARNGDIPSIRLGKKRLRFDWLDVVRHLKAATSTAAQV